MKCLNSTEKNLRTKEFYDNTMGSSTYIDVAGINVVCAVITIMSHEVWSSPLRCNITRH